jgi:hypothetical protein
MTFKLILDLMQNNQDYKIQNEILLTYANFAYIDGIYINF